MEAPCVAAPRPERRVEGEAPLSNNAARRVAQRRIRQAPEGPEREGEVHELLVHRNKDPARERRVLVRREAHDHRRVMQQELEGKFPRGHLHATLEHEER